jgi:RecQ family ATP-dependent DNA helicase
MSNSLIKSVNTKIKKTHNIINNFDELCIFNESNDNKIITKKIKLGSKIIKTIIIDPIINQKIKPKIESIVVKDTLNETIVIDPIITIFSKYYPNKTIKPLQLEIIQAITLKQDVIGILPTGYGKSLCYIIPYLLNPDKVVIIVSPLISLMEDQKDKLEKMNIPVACFHSNINKKKKHEIKEELLENLINTTKSINSINNSINNSIEDINDNDIFDDDNIDISTKSKIKSKSKSKSKSIELISAEKNSLIDSSNKIINNKNNGMIIFLTPEYLIGCEKWIKRLAEQNKLALVAMDEAHCISTWGHDFRPDYQGLYRVKEWIAEYEIPILALTATATSQVESEIKTFLQLSNAKIFKTSFDRPNLNISVKSKSKEFNVILPILNSYLNDFSIIYCKTRDKSEELCEFLKSNNYNAGLYHAGLSANLRLEIQELFANKKLNIIVATVAFGMGIDQDVHLVIHWGCPSDMESYYQEIGRAGRDGIESNCIMFWDKDDFRISRYFLKSIVDIKYKNFRDEQISKMERYCLLNQCRRKIILVHFGEILDNNYSCNKCDNCIKQSDINIINTDNLIYPIFIIAKTIIKYKVGANKITLILKGSKSKTISEYNKFPTYGLLKELTDNQIKQIISILVINNFLKEKTITSGFGTILETTNILINWYAKLCKEANYIDNYKITNNKLTYDYLQPFLMLPHNKLNLNIPSDYNNITNIKFKSTLDRMLNDFNIDL